MVHPNQGPLVPPRSLHTPHTRYKDIPIPYYRRLGLQLPYRCARELIIHHQFDEIVYGVRHNPDGPSFITESSLIPTNTDGEFFRTIVPQDTPLQI